MELNDLWFFFITVLFAGFFFLEGFDYGVGILLPFLGKTDRERRVIINTIGPHWDGNEVWLITAGGAMFAAFPHWYATMFSGFYLALVLMLLALIVRGVGFEFRSKNEAPEWRRLWDWLIFTGSLVPALLWGVAVANIIRGVPIDADMTYTGDLLTLLNPYALLGGAVFVAVFALHGALFLNLKIAGGELADRVHRFAGRIWPIAVVVVVLFVVFSYTETDIFDQLGVNPGVDALGAGLALVAAGWFLRQRQQGWAFVMNGLTILLTVSTVFRGLYPRVLISSTDAAYSLTIENAASSEYTLKIMTVVTLVCLPIVLVYQAWSYWVFRKRLSAESKLEY
jgi:cytochrome d ubiquinol oxidase subunit II